MFPGQQGATWPSQLWPPRLGIKLLEGAPSTEKWRKCVYFRMASRKIGVISLVFAQWVDRAQRGHINRTTPVLWCMRGIELILCGKIILKKRVSDDFLGTKYSF